MRWLLVLLAMTPIYHEQGFDIGQGLALQLAQYSRHNHSMIQAAIDRLD